MPVAVNCCLSPAGTEGEAGVTAIDVSEGATPVPLSATVCGLDVPLSETVRVPERAPMALGLNVTEMVHVAAAARVEGLVGQLLVAT